MPGFPTGEYFLIKSKSCGSCMDVYMGETTPDSNVIIWPQKPSDDQENQRWHHEDGFLINKKSGLVMDIRGGDLQSDKAIVQYDRKMTMAHNQRFGYRDGFIYCLADPRLVLDIKGGGSKDGTKIILYKRKDSGSDNQQWTIVPLGIPVENKPSLNQQQNPGYTRQDAHNQGHGLQHRPTSGGTIPYYPPPGQSQGAHLNVNHPQRGYSPESYNDPQRGYSPEGYGPPDDQNPSYR